MAGARRANGSARTHRVMLGLKTHLERRLTHRCRLTAALLWARFARFHLMRLQLNLNVMQTHDPSPFGTH